MPTAALRRGAARMPGESRAECRSRNIHPGCGTDHRTSGSRSQPCRTCCQAAFSERLIQLFVVRPSAVNDEHFNSIQKLFHACDDAQRETTWVGPARLVYKIFFGSSFRMQFFKLD